jgi:hypothetical protein
MKLGLVALTISSVLALAGCQNEDPPYAKEAEGAHDAGAEGGAVATGEGGAAGSHDAGTLPDGVRFPRTRSPQASAT